MRACQLNFFMCWNFYVSQIWVLSFGLIGMKSDPGWIRSRVHLNHLNKTVSSLTVKASNFFIKDVNLKWFKWGVNESFDNWLQSLSWLLTNDNFASSLEMSAPKIRNKINKITNSVQLINSAREEIEVCCENVDLRVNSSYRLDHLENKRLLWPWCLEGSQHWLSSAVKKFIQFRF